MRNPCPLIGNQRVRYHILAEILLVEIQIGLAQRVRGKRNSLLRHRVGLSLEFLEHGLAEHRALEGLQIVVDEVSPLIL